jgi:hypothetical protein
MFGLFGSMWRPMRHRRRGALEFSGTVELKWLTARSYTTKWYPQGIDFGTWQGRRTLAVSWFRKDKTGRHLASRVTFIDLERSRHLDVALTVEGDGGDLLPAQIHAGGLAWFGDRLFVAATGQGIWEFDLSDTRRLQGAPARRVVGAQRRGVGAVALAAVRTHVHAVPLRCSFLGRVFDTDGTSLPRVLIGEYREDNLGRIGEFTIPDDVDGSFDPLDESSPQIPCMQGAVQWGTRRFISQSRGLKPGVLWDGDSAQLKRSDVPLPIGCEDLALDPEERMLWSLGEHPWRRVVRGIPFARLDL